MLYVNILKETSVNIVYTEYIYGIATDMEQSTRTTTNPNRRKREPQSWTVKDIVHKVEFNILKKPKSGRDATDWPDHPIVVRSKEKVSTQKYIMFLLSLGSGVETLIVNKRDDGCEYAIDGNHRIFAKVRFYNHPLGIFKEYRDDLLFKFIEKTYEKEIQDELKEIFNNFNYTELIDLNYRRFFKTKKFDADWYVKYMKPHVEDWDNFWDGNEHDNIPSFKDLFMTKCNEKLKFTDIQTPVSYSIGLTEEEERREFINVNQFKNSLTDTATSAALLTTTDFNIEDNTIETNIIDACIEYYKKRGEDEVIDCHKQTRDGSLDGFGFLMGYQLWCHKRCSFIESPIDSKSTYELFLKIWRSIFNIHCLDFNYSITTDNVTIFIGYIEYVMGIFNKVILEICPEHISDKLKGTTNTNSYSLSVNNTLVLITAICGFKCNNESDKYVVKNVSLAILYHFFVSTIKTKDNADRKGQKKGLEAYDDLRTSYDGNRLIKVCHEYYIDPNSLTRKILKNRMSEVMNILVIQTLDERYYETRINEPNKPKKDKRRARTIFEILLWSHMFKSKVPYNLLNHIYENEHLFCFSSDWETDKKLDIDRLGNSFPIIKQINRGRSNNHIKKYYEIEKEHNIDFMKYIRPVIPSNEIYDTIAFHDTKSHIINPEEYNKFCESNEQIYIDNMLNEYF